MIHRTIGRRIEALERSRRPMRTGPAFVMATSHVAAQQQIDRLRAEFGDDLLKTMFVMICPRPEAER
jgi:hypothetical protein